MSDDSEDDNLDFKQDFRHLHDCHKLNYHRERYLENVKSMEKELQNVGQIDDIYDYFINNKVKIVKMNHCLTDSGFTHYEGFI